MSGGKKRLTLVTGRRLTQGIALESEGKFSERYLRAAAVIELNPKDAEEAGVKDRCRVTSSIGSVVLAVRTSDEIAPGTAFIPLGPWASAVVEHETECTGMPNLKATEITIEPTDEEVTKVEDVLRMFGFKHVDYRPQDRPLKTGEKKTVSNVVCTFCGDLCDFLTIELDGERIVRNRGGCGISVAKFTNYHRHRVLKPMIRGDDGKFREVSLDEALDKAAEILAKAKFPLLYGWSSTSNEAMEIAVHLAEVTGGIIDNTATICHGPTSLGAQEVGTARATLGVIKHLADLVIFWGCNPAHAHPNHIARWVLAEGRHRKGRKDRKVVVVDIHRTGTARQADLFIQVEPGRDYELATALRMAVKDMEIEAPQVAGVPTEKIIELADMMRSARYGVIFIGMGVTMTGAKFRTIEEVIKLAHDLNDWTRFVVIPMRGHYNVTGTNEVMLWNTGYPYAIQFMDGFPKMITGLSSAVDALVNEEVDAALIVASDPVAHFPRKAVEHLARIPIIAVDPKWSLTVAVADVVIPAAMVGIEADGTAYRMDGVPLHAKKLVDPPEGVPTDVDVLKALLERVMKLKGLAE
ncbi:formylmethanofuran dehydrogenase subunit B [Candidatus Geothermarchaeota archaeon ex4572_27]|nr:MAG: formylmethanofuran dehydrogenase subunit B [Candidatus Geothermarchaeota archaeon ex4572_27]